MFPGKSRFKKKKKKKLVGAVDGAYSYIQIEVHHVNVTVSEGFAVLMILSCLRKP